ncbi:radical SAM family heme chaperone HemW [Paraconexibacter antarcticus]|uniref:Heme chaperone HemW n=1 Tax=Paraconexibacter antarcticus TaxID=2949664 RepID=A0ABY5DQB4_9ACTN|nr:radical SAM family heme chaperone HemW [Paraconexibacter antarcticus]UTI63814.1 radical SAM family heme chaperone HemW [Paraconexibacter antarcticus]
MCAVVPDGEPVPASGLLPEGVRAGAGGRPFGVYLHVPFCATRCGYCDFNTYTAAELKGGVSRTTYAAQALAELRLARQVLGSGAGPVQTVFVGGGTPTLLPPQELVGLLRAIDELFGLTPGAEVTTEANPDSVDAAALATLREGGFTRLSLGMQSAAPGVLATLDRTHTPGRPAAAVAEARAAGFEHVSLDLIYGTPGETAADWEDTLDAALACDPDHISAYGLIVEPGTRLAAQVRRGELPAPDEDTMAARYARTDERLAAAGLRWYEVCNWARPQPGAPEAPGPAACRHNLGYWDGGDWWGIGPGAHSHVGGVRWWNVLHPSAHAARLQAGRSPALGREVLTAEEQRFEAIMLTSRLHTGTDVALLSPAARGEADRLAADGLLDPAALAAGRVVLTLEGRQKADLVVRELTD